LPTWFCVDFLACKRYGNSATILYVLFPLLKLVRVQDLVALWDVLCCALA
jgi:hypothetical protein